jgi:hypothetical protein
MYILEIFLTSAIATILSSISGGGSSIIALPIFLSMGISFPLATAMQKISACFWVLPSAFNYLRGRKINWVFLISFSFIGAIGAYFGALAVIALDQQLLKRIVGICILSLVFYIYWKNNLGIQKHFIKSKGKDLVSYLAAFPMGFYESILGSGNGVIFASLSFYTKGFDFIDALGYYFAAAFSWVVIAALVLIQKGYFESALVLPAVCGSLVGGYCGSRLAKFKGNQFIKNVFVFVGGVLGIKLILGV